jgi:enterochelin esterase family protein
VTAGSAPATDPGSPHRRLAIRALERGERTPAAVDAFLANHDFPLVEGNTVTFVWRGDAQAVNLRHWVYGLPSTQPFRRLHPTDLWYLMLELPESSRVEYKIEIIRGPVHQLIEDPLNEHRARDPFGANSVFHTAGYEVPEWTKEDPEARPGRIEQVGIRSDSLGREVPVKLYLPARFRRARTYPLLVVHDGPDYLEYSGLKTVLDNLIHRLEIPGLVAALLRSEDRLVEYAAHEPHADFVRDELVPRLEEDYPLQGNPAGRCLMGASFGAVAAFSTAVRSPGYFGRLLLQSGSFAFTDTGFHERGPAFDPVVEFMTEWRDEPSRVADRVFVSCGTYESLIYENRSLVPVLQEAGMRVRYVEVRDGHNWENWRDRLREGLSWLYPGPLWMVYE